MSAFSRGSRMPSLEVTEVSRDRVCFTLKNTDTSMANAVRRIMIAEVPTLAVELVTLKENTSVLHDEFIAHRLGLLPIDSRRIREFKYKEDCSCVDKCRNCAVEFSLDIMCQDDGTLAVTHLDIVGTDPDPRAPMPVPRSEDCTEANGGIVIAKLRKNQTLKCDLVASKGVGLLHAKWIPVATAVFQYEPDITLNRKLLESVPTKVQHDVANSCPRGVYAFEEDIFGGTAELDVVNKMACIFCDECVDCAKEAGYPDLVKVAQRPDIFRFVVESTGVMPAEQIVEMAFEILEQKLEKIRSETSKLEGFSSSMADSGDRSMPRSAAKSAKRESAFDDFKLDLS